MPALRRAVGLLLACAVACGPPPDPMGTGGGSATGGGGGRAGGGGGGAGGQGGGLDGGDDAGEVDAGEVDGGGSDAGTGGGGPDAGMPFETDAGGVMMWGSLDPRLPFTTMALAYTADPTQPIVGFGGGSIPSSALLRPNGRVLYFDDDFGVVRELVVDAFEPLDAGNGSVYPTAAQDNDLVQSTPQCTVSLDGFWVAPETDILVTACNGLLNYHARGFLIPPLNNRRLLAMGRSEIALTADAVVNLIDGGALPLTGLDAGVSLAAVFSDAWSYRSIHATDSGFLVPLGGPPDGFSEPCELWSVDFGGAATRLGPLAPLPAGVTSTRGCGGRFDEAGTFYGIAARGAADAGVDVVVQRPVLGSSTVIYDEANATPSDLSVYPPIVYTQLQAAGALVAGP